MSDRFRGKYIAGNNAAFPAGLQGVLTVSDVTANAQRNAYWRVTASANYAYYLAGTGIILNPNPAPPLLFNQDAFSSSDGSILVADTAPYADNATISMPAGIISVAFSTVQQLTATAPVATTVVTPAALKQAAQLTPVAFGITMGTLSAISLSATDMTVTSLCCTTLNTTQMITPTAFAANTMVPVISANTMIASGLSGTNCYAVSTFNATVSGSCIGTATNVSSLLNVYASEVSGTFWSSSPGGAFTGQQMLVNRSTPAGQDSIYFVRASGSFAENNYGSQVSAIYVYRHNASFGTAGDPVPAGATQVLDINRAGAYNGNSCNIKMWNSGLTAFQTNSASFYLGLFAYAINTGSDTGSISYPDISVEEFVA